jgi:translation initiation factor 1A
MPANKHGGKKYKKGKKGDSMPKPLVTKDTDQLYAKVTKLLGNDRILAILETTKKPVLCHVRGSMRKKKQWVGQGDVVLVAPREFQTDHFDVLHKYTPDDIKELRQMGHVKNNTFDDEKEDGKYSHIVFVSNDDEGGDANGSYGIESQNRVYDISSSDEAESDEESVSDEYEKDLNIDDI